MSLNAMDFIVQFLAYCDSEGIYDKFDSKSNKMETSHGVQQLIKQARELAPESLKGKGKQAASKMRELSDAERDKAIAASEQKVIDARTLFAKKIAVNNGATGLLEKFVSGNATVEDVQNAMTLLEYNNA